MQLYVFYHPPWFPYPHVGVHNIRDIPLNTWRNDNVVITSKRRHFDVITSKWRRFDVITTLLLRNVFAGMPQREMLQCVMSSLLLGRFLQLSRNVHNALWHSTGTLSDGIVANTARGTHTGNPERCRWCEVPWPDSIEQPQMGHKNCKSYVQGQLHHGSTEEECSGVL